MNNYLLALPLIFFSSVQAAPLTLDFTSGEYKYSTYEGKSDLFDTYTQDGFTLATVEYGNHLDPKTNPLSELSQIAFHNGIGNVVSDNNLVLTYAGGTFDLTGSNGNTFSLLGTDTGLKPLSFLNITSVIFSITGPLGDINTKGGAGWDSLTVDTMPSAVPIPAAVWLFGSGLIGLLGMRKKAPTMSV